MATRFDDRLATMLAAQAPPGPVRTAYWVEAADILAQRGDRLPAALAASALAWLAAARDDVPLATRAALARSIAPLARFAPLVALFAHDAPAVARPLLARAPLDDHGWRAVLPTLDPARRAIVAARDDRRSAAAARSMHRPSGPLDGRQEEPGRDGHDIARIVRRLERLRATLARTNSSPDTARLDSAPGFDFETGRDGVIHRVDNLPNGVPRGALIGLSLAAHSGPLGLDPAGARAFRDRAFIADTPIVLPDALGLAGHWRCRAAPVFDRKGAFSGYRGHIRPAPPPAPHDHGPVRDGDAVRAVVHELRTPLNAISGFAQVIAAEIMGPAPARDRDLARGITADAAATLAMVGTLDLALRADALAAEARAAQRIDLAALLDRAIALHCEADRPRPYTLPVEATGPCWGHAAPEPTLLLLRALLAAFDGGEAPHPPQSPAASCHLRCTREGDWIALRIAAANLHANTLADVRAFARPLLADRAARLGGRLDWPDAVATLRLPRG